jgi:hypothetical protein
MQRTPTQRLADALLTGSLDAFVAARRPGKSWRVIAIELRDATSNDVDVTPQALSKWYADADTERVA